MRQCLVLSSAYNTGIEFWLSLNLSELGDWIKASNELQKERQKALEK